MIYFDNAATTGHKPQSVINAVENTLKNLSANPGRGGYTISQKAAEVIYSARKKTAEFFGCKGEESVVFTQNCTTSINYVLKGVLSQGDHIVISDLEHNAVMRPINTMKVEYSIANVSNDDEETVENFKKVIKQNTKMIFCTAASNVTGDILPLKKIGKLCKNSGILFGVDAAQAAGVIPINMQEMNIDFLCIAPHKGLYSPMGLGILIAIAPIKKTLIEGGTGTESNNYFQPSLLPEMLESGTVNLPAIAAVPHGIDFVKKRQKSIFEYEKNLVKYFFNALREDVIFYKNPLNEKVVPVLCFNFYNQNSEETAQILSSRGFALRAGLHCAPAAHKKLGTIDRGAVRFSPSIFNNKKEVDMLINCIKNLKKYEKHY